MKPHPKRLLVSAFLLAMSLFANIVPCGAQQSADFILHNGKILTVDENLTVAQAVAIRGNQVAAVGESAEVLAMRGTGTQLIDLKGRTVIPGLIDTHRHIYGSAESYGNLTDHEQRRYPLDWRAVRTKQDVLDQIKSYMDRYQFEPGQWVYFTGGPRTKAQAEILYDQMTADDLAPASPDNPIMLGMGVPDFNGLMVNRVALDMLWSRHGDYIRRYGRYWIDKAGNPDGHLEPPASRLLLPYTYDRKPEVLGPLYKMENDELHSMGITMVGTRLPQDSLAAYQWLRDRGEMTLRLGRGMVEPFGTITDLDTGMQQMRGLTGSGDDFLWVTGIGPTAVDGQNSRACTDLKRSGEWTDLDSWYPTGQCHTDSEYKGAPARAANIRGHYYRDWMLASGREGVRFANVHVSGDRAVGTLLNIIEQVQQQHGKDSTKDWAFDHCVLVNPKDFERAARLGVMFSCMPGRVINREIPGMVRAYGEEVAHTWAAPMKSLMDAGVRVVFETDTNVYVWTDIEVMINRKDENGKVWGAQEALDRPTALRTITRWAADYMLKGDKAGSLEPGKLADLVVLDKDYMTIPADDISTIAPQLTMVDGKVVYLHTDFAAEYGLQPAPRVGVVSSYKDLVARKPGD